MPALRAGGTVPASPPRAGCGAGSWCPRRGAQGLLGLRAQQRAGTSATAPHVHPPGPFRGLCPARCARFTRSCASPGDTRVQVGTAPCTAPHPQRSARPPGPLPPPRRGAFLAKLFLLNNAELLNLLHFSKLESAEAQRAFSLRRQQSAPCLLPDGRARQLWGGGFALRGAAPSWGVAAAAPSSLGFCPPTPRRRSCSSLAGDPLSPRALLPHVSVPSCAEVTSTLARARPCSQISVRLRSPCSERHPSPRCLRQDFAPCLISAASGLCWLQQAGGVCVFFAVCLHSRQLGFYCGAPAPK